MMNYPEPQAIVSGSKVARYYYTNLAQALIAGKMARMEAANLAAQGYDFGYCAPGSVTSINEGPYKGMHEVTIP